MVEPDEIRDIIEACKVCRLGFCEEGEVYIVPVNFGYDMKGKELTLYIHCAGEGRKIDLIRKNAKVGIEMDCHHELAEGDLACQYSYYYASLIGNGHAKIVEETYKKKEALGKIMEHQTGKIFDESEMNPKLVESVTVLKIDLNTYTCKRHSKISGRHRTRLLHKMPLGNTAQRLCDRCVREDTKQALKGNLQADGVQSRQTLFVRDCHYFCFLFQGVITVKIPPRILSMRIPISPMRIMHTITTSDCIRLLALLMR